MDALGQKRKINKITISYTYEIVKDKFILSHMRKN